jgi:succinyl-diaminopimelate desuccinylase
VRESSPSERLISYDTSTLEGIRGAAEFVIGWLEARDIEVFDAVHRDRPLLAATVGAGEGPTVVLHGHIDVVPGRPEQFHAEIDGDRLIGRGAYDMKGALAAMMTATRDLADQREVRVHFLCVCDEESDDPSPRASDLLLQRGYRGDFAITGEPTELRIGVQAKGVLGLRLDVGGKAAHGSTPWLGDNAVVKAVETFEQIRTLAFARESSELFDRPSINLGRILGGDALNKVPDRCIVDLDIRYLPGQRAEDILEAIRALPDVTVTELLRREPVIVDAANPYVRTLAEVVAGAAPAERVSVGRDGASDAVCFLAAGVPAVEFGPEGGGHHGPDEWVSISSLDRYRRALVEFVRLVPQRLGSRRLHVA